MEMKFNGKVSGEAEKVYQGKPKRDEDYNRCEIKLKEPQHVNSVLQ